MKRNWVQSGKLFGAAEYNKKTIGIYLKDKVIYKSCAAPIKGMRRTKTSFVVSGFIFATNFTFLWRHAKVWIILEATTDGLSKASIETSVTCPRILVLIGQQISKSVFLLYSLDDNTNAGLYFPISFPFLGSNHSTTFNPQYFCIGKKSLSLCSSGNPCSMATAATKQSIVFRTVKSFLRNLR